MTLASFRASGESLSYVAARKTGELRRIPIERTLGELLDQAIGTRTEG